MRKVTFTAVLQVLLSIFMVGSLVACDPETPENERKNKLHEDPIRAVFTLQEGTLKSPHTWESNPQITDFQPTGTAQVIEWATSDKEGWHVTSSQNSFAVKNTIEHPEAVYSLKIDYYNDKGELMNYGFIDNDQYKIHQHFFSMYKEVLNGNKKSSLRVTKKKDLPYDYLYADQVNGLPVEPTNPLGFQGFIKFTQPGKQFDLSVDLLHASDRGKLIDGKPSPFYLPAQQLISTGQWDINVKLPIRIEGQSEEETPALDPSLIAPATAVIEIYDGHLHGPLAFHQNPLPVENKYIGKNYRLTYTLVDGQWKADQSNPKAVNLIGSQEGHGVTALSIRYYDKDGDDMTGDLFNNNEQAHYQHFFLAQDIKAGYGGTLEASDKNDPTFFDYTYCDTKPWNQSNKFDKAPFVGEQDPVGIKGFFKFLKTHKKFNLAIQLMRARDTKFVGGKPSPFYAPTATQRQQEAWMPTLSIPVNVYLDVDEKTLDADLFVELDELSTDESTYSERDRRAIHSLMDAFGISFQEAISEFYWNLNGDRKEDATGFWF